MITDAFQALLDSAPESGCRPFPRRLLTAAQWSALAEALSATPEAALLALWGEPGFVHAAFLHETEGRMLLASAPAEGGRYAALSPARPGAQLFERAVCDLWGLVADGATDARPWLDHGTWPLSAPMATRPVPHDGVRREPVFLPVEGEDLHIIPVGPVHAGIIEPGHFRFTAQGETVARLEVRLGYAHKGTLSLMLGKTPRAAARLACRISGDSAVAHSLAFAQAAEAALGVVVPPRAENLRGVAAELERIANHISDFGAVVNDAAFAPIPARCGLLRDSLLRAAAAAFGHRLMFDLVVPGGVAQDIAEGGAAAIQAALAALVAELPALTSAYENFASLTDRVVGTGAVGSALVARFAAGGFVGRAAGRGFDARRVAAYPPYRELDVQVPLRHEGDVDARLRVRLFEIDESVRLVRALLASLPDGPVSTALPARAGEGAALIEGFRGEILAWLRLDEGGLIRGMFQRDPSWLQWRLLEAAIEDNIVADFPLCNKSFNCSYSGVDL
jgi:Ni,Fe-hydrogenase III large subunit